MLSAPLAKRSRKGTKEGVGASSSMGDDNFRPALNQGFAYDGAILKGAHTRRRLAMGRDAALESEPDEERDPEGPVTDYDELVRAAVQHASTFKHPMHVDDHVTMLDLRKLGRTKRQLIVDKALQTSDQNNELFLQKLQERIRRAGVKLPTVTVCFKGLNVSTTVYVGSRALPSTLNAYRNFIEDFLIRLRIMKGLKQPFTILDSVSGVLRPGRLTLLLGPPGAGKTTLLRTLAGKYQKDTSLKVSGDITYNGEPFANFYPQRTAAYVDQVDLHTAELTVRETLDFGARVQGTGLKAGFLRQLRDLEAKGGIHPDPDVDAYLKASAVEGTRRNPVTQYMIRILGLEVCQDTLVGNDMVRGISGGQKKRVTTGEMVVGPKNTLFLDEISTGLDSSTTFLIVRCIRNFAHTLQGTVLMALLQPAPEVYELFDDILLMAESHVVYHGPKEAVLPFFERLGFRLPPRKGIGDFLQEVTSKKDQAQYWADASKPYRFMPVKEFADAFAASPLGRRRAEEVEKCCGPPKEPPTPDPLVRTKYALGPLAVFRACFQREWVLMRRHSFVYIFRTIMNFVNGFIASMLFIRPTMHRNNLGDSNLYAGVLFYSQVHMLFDGFTEMAIQIDSLPVFYRQRDSLFFPSWAFALPVTLLRLPYSLVESALWSAMLYWIIGFDPDAGRYFTFFLVCFLTHQTAINLFRLMGAIGRSLVVAYVIAWLLFLLLILLCGFVLARPQIPPWFIGGYWALPLQWLISSAEANEFTSPRWQVPYKFHPEVTLGNAVASEFGWRNHRVFVWVGVAVACGWICLLNVLTILALKVLNPRGSSNPIVPEEQLADREHLRMGASANGAAAEEPLPVAAATELPAEVDRPQEERKARLRGASTDGFPSVTPTSGQEYMSAPGDEESKHAQHELERFYSARPSITPDDEVPAAEVELTPHAGAHAAPEAMAETVAETAPEAAPEAAPAMKPDQRGWERETTRMLPGTVSPESAQLQRSEKSKGMVLPFCPLNLAFSHMYYSVDLPPGSEAKGEAVEGVARPQLVLLTDISGCFRPGVLTCLMGVSGAGKTTLMDVLAGRKTGGHVRGTITVDGHPKDQATFNRVSGYVEQFDIHSPASTVKEALNFSAELRLEGVDAKQRKAFVGEVLELMELAPLASALVGVPGVSGLSVEQRKRLTIGVELVANPSIIFMDEPTSGLDARAAAIVMRTVRNTVNTGRTVVCTIHQPSIDIFEAFDELHLLKRGGKTIYAGPTGTDSAQLVSYFEAVPGVPPLQPGMNPATWMLEITAFASKERLGVDFADIWAQSGLARQRQELIESLQHPAPGSEPLKFSSKYARSIPQQFLIILKKFFTLYNRMPEYNAVRFFFTCVFGLLIGAIYWRKGQKRHSTITIQGVLGALLTSSIFLGTSNASTVQPVADTERSVFYRERAAGYYAELAWAAGEMVVELPYLLLQTCLYSVITYFMIWFEINAAKFWIYWAFTFMTLTFFTMYGMMTVAISPNVQVSAIISSACYSSWFLLAGFVVPRPRIPGWLIWMHWIDPLNYSVEGLIASQLGNVHDEYLALEDGMLVSCAEYIRIQYGYKWSFIGPAAAVLVGFSVLFMCINAFALKRFNFQQR
ncbi:hypothetical protein CVIRNUC_001857 [Coccomyxa viridis]|uniref:ABC transporter domain-containing protein n=1 Tax=Coccomyxa viridis TaxID=1274662 RepID=A0AAV1HVS7_9CHLO|nr:hypothetical protein CVIRNUC_001857 [Coccomyxa viridis]